MHVLIVSDADSRYGASHSLKQMVKELLNSYENDIKISVLLLSTARSLKNELEKYGAYVICVKYEPYYQGVPYDKWKKPIKYVIKGIGYLWGKYIGVRKIDKCMNMSEIDIIHSNSSREDLGALLAEKHHKPLLWHIREFGDEDYRCYSYRKDYIELMNRTADKLIVVSDAVRNHWIKKGIFSEKILTVYNGVEWREDEGVAEIVNLKDKVKIIMMGSISETKGQMQLLAAIAQMKSELRNRISVDIVGSGPNGYMKRLQRYIMENGLEKTINLKGYIDDSSKLLNQYHLGIVCSRSEGFGRVTAEYMMAGLSVIASNTGANDELIRDGVDGLLYTYGMIEDLCSKVEYLCNYPDKLAEFGSNARIRAVERFTANINAKNIYQEYKNILNDRKKEYC